MRLILRLVVNALALGLAVWLFDGITMGSGTDTEHAVRLVVVGAIFGLVIGAGGFAFIPSHFWPVTVGVMVVLAVVCGVLAAKYGDWFWEHTSGWFRWW